MSDVQQDTTPVESGAPSNPVYRHISNPIEDIGEAENLQIATAETRRRRESDGMDSGVDSDRAPVHEWSGKDFTEPGPHESPHSQVKRAAQAMTDVRKQQLGQQYLKSWGYSDQDAEALGFTVADEAARLGRSPTESPITAMQVVREDGTVALPPR